MDIGSQTSATRKKTYTTLAKQFLYEQAIYIRNRVVESKSVRTFPPVRGPFVSRAVSGV